jgi:hypothetical protein
MKTMNKLVLIFFLFLFSHLNAQPTNYDNSGQSPDLEKFLPASQFIDWPGQSATEATAFTVTNSFATPTSSVGDLAYDGNSLWLAAFGGMIYKLNPQDGTRQDSVTAPVNNLGGITFGDGHLWVSESQDTTIYKIDPVTKSVVGTISHNLGDYVHGMQFIDGAIHVNMFYLGTTDTTFVLDTTGTVLSKTPNGFDFSHGLSYDGCFIWITANNINGGSDAFIFRKDPVTFATLDMEIVPGGRFPNGIVWDGNYLWVANNQSDSIFQLQLNTPTATNSMITENACEEFLSPSGKIWTTSGMYMDTIANAGGCDSLMTIDLTINTVDTSLSANNITLTSNATGATYQWIDCDNGNAVLNGETGQSFTASVNGNYAVIVSQNGCEDTSACYAINTVGIYDNSFGPSLTVFPNPSHGSFMIDLGQPYQEVSIIITSTMGKKVMDLSLDKMQKQQIDFKAPTGLYLVHVRAGDGQSAVMKILID